MNRLRRPCCEHVRITRPRAAGFAGWIVPGMMLILMPKCPACLAGYVALVSGIGMSLPVATAVRTGLIAVCAAALAFLVIRLVHARLKKKEPHPRRHFTGD